MSGMFFLTLRTLKSYETAGTLLPRKMRKDQVLAPLLLRISSASSVAKVLRGGVTLNPHSPFRIPHFSEHPWRAGLRSFVLFDRFDDHRLRFFQLAVSDLGPD